MRKLPIAIPAFLIAGSFLLAHLCFWLFPNVFQAWNAQTVDRLFVMRSSSENLRPPYDQTVVHVDFNNTSMQQLDNLYLNRAHLARVITNLKKMKVAAQAYDFIFGGKLNADHDAAMIQATLQAGNVYYGLAMELESIKHLPDSASAPTQTIPYLDQTKWKVTLEGDSGSLYTGRNPLITFPELSSASRGLGSLSVKFDADGVLRRVPLLVRYSDGFYPLLPLRVICDFLSVRPDRIILRAGSYIVLPDARKPDEAAARDIKIPIDRRGNMIINYLGPWERMDHYNFADILQADRDEDELEIWAEELEGKIVIVSDVSTGSTDVGPVPTDARFPLSGAHANIIQNIVSESFLRELTAAQSLLAELVIMALLLIMSIRFTSVYFSIGTVCLAGAYVIAIGLAFFYGNLIFPIIRPLLIILAAVLSILVYRYIREEREKMAGLRQRDFIRDTFGRYLSNEVVEELLDSPDGLGMKGEIRDVTFLVSDLRGFTVLTEQLQPQQVIEIINRYFGHMVEVIARYRGTVSEFQGDGILIFFGAPLSAEDDPQRAVACAVEMQNVLVEVNDEQRRLGLPELAMGIGINTGPVVVGNIGSERRASYGAVGSPINVAFRIESYTVGDQILISPSTYHKVRDIADLRGTRQVDFKGLDQPITLYDIGGLGGPYQVRMLEKKTESLAELASPLAIECFALKGKTVSPDAIAGCILKIGNKTAQASLEKKIPSHTNLKISLRSNEFSNVPEIYAKVLSEEGSASDSELTNHRIEFTWMPEEFRRMLREKM